MSDLVWHSRSHLRKLGSSRSFGDDPLLSPIQETRPKVSHKAKKRRKSLDDDSSLDIAGDDLHQRHSNHGHRHHRHRHHHRSHRSKSRDKELDSRDIVGAPSIFDAVTAPSFDAKDPTALEENRPNGIHRLQANSTNKQEQARDLDEAFRMYIYAEKAALKIQQAFRERQKEKGLVSKQLDDSDASTTENHSEDPDEVGTVKSEEDTSNKYTVIFLALFLLVMTGPKLVMSCWSVIKKCFGGDDTGGADAIANQAAMPPGGGGGGGGGAAPAPTGGEGGAAGGAGGAQAGAQGAMAAQAASSAAGGAASGVASGAAAGAAASSAAAAATAGATAAAAGATQVAAVVAVSTAAAAAAATTAVVANYAPPEPILSVCGLANPDIRSGRMVMLFEGVPRPFDDRESGLVSNLVLGAYNEITLGTNVAVTGCLDPLAREMRSVSIVNQTLSALTDGPVSTILEVVFEAQVACDRCSETSPLFSEDQLEQQDASDGNGTDITAGNVTDSSVGITSDFGIVSNATTEGVVQLEGEQSRLLQTGGFSVDFSSQKFFQKLIQLVIFETEELSDQGELPEGFVQISKASVITNVAEEEELVTEIRYKRDAARGGGTSSSGGGGGNTVGGGGGNVRATFEFEFVDSSGQIQKETVAVTEEGGAVPTTAFPTFEPSHAPTDLPSMSPTNVFSGQPTTLPSAGPTDTPSSIPSISPSEAPSAVPSEAPSQVPSVVPSESPSMIPSVSPSEEPSMVPSMVPSEVPSTTPSMIPSMIPSTVPSMMPSMIPSTLPSMIPSEVPSETPSFVPSFVPSESPSMQPSMVPSASPSKSPTMAPSSQPSGNVVLIVPGMSTAQSSPYDFGHPWLAIDGSTAGNYAAGQSTHTQIENDPWWYVNIGAGWGNRPSTVKYVSVWNRSDCCAERLYGGWVQLLASNGAILQQKQITSAIGFGGQTLYFSPQPNVWFIKIQLYGAGRILSLAEVQAVGFVQ